MTIEELKQPYEPEGVYAGMTQAEALRYLAKRYLRNPECVALCNEVANNLPKLIAVAEAAQDLLDNAEPKWGDKVVVHRSVIQALRKALEELNNE
jgi:hypothetical protein